MKRFYFVTCPICGSNLDPGERCTCLQDESKDKTEEKKIKDQNMKVVGFRGGLYPTGKLRKK